jgi:hypothetical protein
MLLEEQAIFHEPIAYSLRPIETSKDPQTIVVRDPGLTFGLWNSEYGLLRQVPVYALKRA